MSAPVPSRSPTRLLITGGSGLLALNWAWSLRDRIEIILATNSRTVDLAGLASHKINLDSVVDITRYVDMIKPDIIVHTAGLTDVDKCEVAPDLAHHANVILTKNVARVASVSGAKFIHISTDHLFCGEKSLYEESSLTQPLNEYGKSKLLAESCVLEHCPDALIVRTNFFGWGHAYRQSFSDWIIGNLRSRKHLTLFDDVYFTPILADTLAEAALDLAESGASGVFNLVGDERLSKYDFAMVIVSHFGLPCELISKTHLSELDMSAERPRDMSLDNSKAREYLGREMGRVDEFVAKLKLQENQGRRTALLRAVK